MGGQNSTQTIRTKPERRQKINEFHEELEENDDSTYSDDEELFPNVPLKGARSDDGIGSDMNPERLRNSTLRKMSIVDTVDSAALSVNPQFVEFPFENLVLEGGGNKGLAYVGAVQCFEELDMMKQIKRVGGASAGAITAALVALGYKSNEIRDFLSSNIEEVFVDHSCGYFSLIPNLLTKFGWNPGNKIYSWFGDAIEEKTGDPDTNFYDLYKLTGIELCVVVTNLNLMSAQYCHPKTTPDMPIRDALRMTMAIPGFFSPMQYDNHGQVDMYVDGGVLVNYPVNCFDGWYLSMAKEDSFLQKLRPLKDMPQLMASNNRFKATGPNKTIGFLLFDDTETEILRYNLEKRIGTLLPEKPKVETELFKEREKKKIIKIKALREHSRIVHAVESFLKVLHKYNVDDQEFISKDELRQALNDDAFDGKHRELLFGKDVQVDKAFEILDKDGNNKIAFFELIQFIEERGIRMQMRFIGYSRKEVETFPAFLNALQGTLLTNMKYVSVTEADTDRTVGINTGHIGTMDYTLEESDREFVCQRGYNATLSFLRYFAANNPTLVKERKPKVHTDQPTSVHGDREADNNNAKDTESLLRNRK